MARNDGVDPVDVHVGAAVARLRGARRVSQKALGDAIGVSFQQVQKYELGTNRVACSMLAKIAQALGASPGDFFPDAVVHDKPLIGVLKARGTTPLLDACEGLSFSQVQLLVRVALEMGSKGIQGGILPGEGERNHEHPGER